MAGMSIDDSELRAFAVDLTRAGAGAAAAVRPVVSKGALNIKNQLVEEMSASRSFGALAPSITYDLDDDGLGAEIGPTKRSGGAGTSNLGFGANIAYFGTSRGGGTVPDPQGALDAEAPRFEKAALDVIEGLLR